MADQVSNVFISYSHDSPEHARRVLGLAERLRKDGIDAQIDQYVGGRPPEGWPRWMLDRVHWADFVLMIFTEVYYRRFRGHEEPSKGKGVDWESQVITLEIYNAKSRTTKFAPVIFGFRDREFIPEPLSDQFYILDSEESYQELYGFLTDQAGVAPGARGEQKRLAREPITPLRFDQARTGRPTIQPVVTVSHPRKPITLFYSYSHKDELIRDELQTHLSILRRMDVISQWHDRRIAPGEEWDMQIDRRLKDADVILLLVSSDFLASDYCYGKEMIEAVRRHDKGQARVIPVILRSCDWRGAPFSRLQALPKSARPINEWNNRDEAFTDVARGLRLVCEELLINSVKEETPLVAHQIPQPPEIRVICADICDLECDVLVLKFAQRLYGADKAVAQLLQVTEMLRLEPGKYSIFSSGGHLSPKQVLFVGVLSLGRFNYGQIREFARYALRIVASQLPTAGHVAFTVHGVGFGLDERESFSSVLRGLLDAIADNTTPQQLKHISIVEKNPGRAERFSKWLQESLRLATGSQSFILEAGARLTKELDEGVPSSEKPHVFIAIRSSEDMEDIYVFGIQNPVNVAGYLCERFKLRNFTDEVLKVIKARIASAVLLIADLTGADPDVYLEIGYAWGCNRPTLLVAHRSEKLVPNAGSEKCIRYDNIRHLSKVIEEYLKLEFREQVDK
jgi:hypothetical protein